MTQPDAQPRTEAGRAYLAEYGSVERRKAILAIEAEAAAPSLLQERPSVEQRCNWRMETLIRYAVEQWGPEADVEPESDNASMQADLETFLDAEPASLLQEQDRLHNRPWRPDYAVHPGETLKELIADRGWTQTWVADQCGVSQKHISEIVNGKAGIGPTLAVALERVIGARAEFWGNLQSNYEITLARLGAASGAPPMVSIVSRAVADRQEEPATETHPHQPRASLTLNPKFGAALWIDARLVARIAASIEHSRITPDNPVPQWRKDAMTFVNAVNEQADRLEEEEEGSVAPLSDHELRRVLERRAEAPASLLQELREWLRGQSRLAHEQANILPGDPDHAWDAGAAHMADATLTHIATLLERVVEAEIETEALDKIRALYRWADDASNRGFGQHDFTREDAETFAQAEDGIRTLENAIAGRPSLLQERPAARTLREAIEAGWHSPNDCTSLLQERDRLTFATFAAVNRDRCEAADGFGHPLGGWSRSDWFLAAMGEFGEAANKAKKLNRVRDGIPGNSETPDELRAGLADEIADAVIYLDLLAQSEGFDLGTIVASKFDRTSEKIGAPHRLGAASDTEETPRG